MVNFFKLMTLNLFDFSMASLKLLGFESINFTSYLIKIHLS